MSWPRGTGPLQPTVAERAAARFLDLLRAGVALAIGLLPAAFAELSYQSLMDGEWTFQLGRVKYLPILHLIVFGVVVALGYELVRLARKGTTAGRASLRLELGVAREPGMVASRRRAVSRYLVTVGACVAASGAAFVVAAAVGIRWSPGRVMGLAVVPCAAVWASCLLSASMRADRRGWHDVVSGTVLVSATGSPRPSQRGPGGESFDRWQGFMRGGGLSRGAVRLCA